MRVTLLVVRHFRVLCVLHLNEPILIPSKKHQTCARRADRKHIKYRHLVFGSNYHSSNYSQYTVKHSITLASHYHCKILNTRRALSSRE